MAVSSVSKLKFAVIGQLEIRQTYLTLALAWLRFETSLAEL
jgi:hypothetical protein